MGLNNKCKVKDFKNIREYLHDLGVSQDFNNKQNRIEKTLIIQKMIDKLHNIKIRISYQKTTQRVKMKITE